MRVKELIHFLFLDSSTTHGPLSSKSFSKNPPLPFSKLEKAIHSLRLLNSKLSRKSNSMPLFEIRRSPLS
ncbi:hypothetical protein KY285_031174 [Solanum tuberosum]|nr:hypothetical protein KY285_031174 [Solanum tuberosum]